VRDPGDQRADREGAAPERRGGEDAPDAPLPALRAHRAAAEREARRPRARDDRPRARQYGRAQLTAGPAAPYLGRLPAVPAGIDARATCSPAPEEITCGVRGCTVRALRSPCR